MGKRLIEQQRPGLRKQRSQQRDARPLPAGERGGIARSKSRQPERLERIGNELGAFAAACCFRGSPNARLPATLRCGNSKSS